MRSLLSRGLRDPVQAAATATSPTFGSFRQPERQPSWPIPAPAQQSQERDGLAAANLFVTGLSIELAKPVEPAVRVPLRLAGEVAAPSGATRADVFSGNSGSESEEDGAEGTYFSLERTLDLVVGVRLLLLGSQEVGRRAADTSLSRASQLTDSYRYGVLKPVDGMTSTSDPTDAAATLWARGAQVAEETLRHPMIREPTASSSHPVVDSPTRSASVSSSPSPTSHIPGQIAFPTIRTASPRRATVERSYTHPSTSIPSATFVSPKKSQSLPSTILFTPQIKHRLTIEIHLLYLLALQKYPVDRAQSERYWTEIITVASRTGGVVGTKEGNEIVAKASRRLQASTDPTVDQSWKLSKRNKTTSNASSLRSVGSLDNLETRRGKGASSGDALVDMWYERRHSEDKGKGKGRETEDRIDEDGPEAESDYNASTVTLRPSRKEASTQSDETIRPSRASTSMRDVAELVASVKAVVSIPRSMPKLSKFHFATTIYYPSPPDTPSPSPPTSITTPARETSPRRRTTAVRSPPESPSRAHKGPLPQRLRRLSSTASFQAPTMPRLLRRAESSASVSTLPPDFFSTKVRNPAARRDWRTSSQPTQSPFGLPDPMLLPSVRAKPQSPAGWSSGFWHGVKSIRSTSSRVASSINPFKPDPAPSAMAVLQRVLIKDEQSAGPGMYWGDASDAESAELLSVGDDGNATSTLEPQTIFEEPAIFAPVASGSGTTTSRKDLIKSESRPSLSQRRSFVDVTSSTSSASALCPRVVYTPPTPEKGSSFTHTTSRSVSSPTLSKHRGQSDIDPLLLELERKSRVGVKTTCGACGKHGLNFPAIRSGQTFCSRECRLGAREAAMAGKGKLAEVEIPTFR